MKSAFTPSRDEIKQAQKEGLTEDVTEPRDCEVMTVAAPGATSSCHIE
jgi:hypothetical protein